MIANIHKSISTKQKSVKTRIEVKNYSKFLKTIVAKSI